MAVGPNLWVSFIVATHEDPEGDFSLLVSNGAIKLTMQSSFHKSHVYYVVPISNYAIVTGLAIRA